MELKVISSLGFLTLSEAGVVTGIKGQKALEAYSDIEAFDVAESRLFWEDGKNDRSIPTKFDFCDLIEIYKDGSVKANVWAHRMNTAEAMLENAEDPADIIYAQQMMIKVLKYELSCSTPAPAWAKCTQMIDPETLVLITEAVMYTLYHTDKYGHVEPDDSRFAEQVCIEACELFCETHKPHEEEPWKDDVYGIAVNDFLAKLLERLTPDWLNNQYKGSYGKETVKDLMEDGEEKT